MQYLPSSKNVPHHLDKRQKKGVPQNPETAWDNFDHKAEVRDALYPRQHGLCAYCENSLDTELGQHIEHIQPKKTFPAGTFEYSNLMLSCIDSNNIGLLDSGAVSCGAHKGRRYDAVRFISPTDSVCEEYFSYSLIGEVQSRSDQPATQDKARYTVELLNLNCRRLVRERADMLLEGFKIIRELQNEPEALQRFLDCELNPSNGKLRSYINTRRQHFAEYLI
jgi:uncharacterized protein (TIGR02646 family)